MESEAYQDGTREAWRDVLSGWAIRVSFEGLRYDGRSEEYVREYEQGYRSVWKEQLK